MSVSSSDLPEDMESRTERPRGLQEGDETPQPLALIRVQLRQLKLWEINHRSQVRDCETYNMSQATGAPQPLTLIRVQLRQLKL